MKDEGGGPQIVAEAVDSLPTPAIGVGFLTCFMTMAVLFSIGQFHRSSGGVIATVFADSFALAPSFVGLLVGSMFIAQSMAQIPAGVLLDRFGPRRVISFGCFIAAGGSGLVALAPDWTQILLGRFIIGVGFSPSLMCVIAFISNWTGPARMPLLAGRLLSIGMVGGILGTGPMAMSMELWGWRMTYGGIGVATAILAGAALLILRDHPPGTPIPTGSRGQTLWQVVRGFAQIVARREMWPILFIAPFLYCPSQILVGLWMAHYLSDVHHMGVAGRGLALTAMMAAMGIGVLLYGAIDARLRDQKQIVTMGSVAVALSFAALAVFGHVAPAVAIGAGIATILFSTFFVIVISHAQGLFPSSHSGRAAAAVGVLGLSGVFVMQSLSAMLLTLFPGLPGQAASLTGYQMMFAVLAVLFIAIAVIWAHLADRRC